MTTINYAIALIAYLNSTETTFRFNNRNISKAEVNSTADSLIAQGVIIAHPGDPYTYTLAE